MDTWLWTPLTLHVSRVFNRIRNIVDSPGGNPENEPKLPVATVETTGGRGATITQINFALRYNNNYHYCFQCSLLHIRLGLGCTVSCIKFNDILELKVAH